MKELTIENYLLSQSMIINVLMGQLKDNIGESRYGADKHLVELAQNLHLGVTVMEAKMKLSDQMQDEKLKPKTSCCESNGYRYS